MKTTSTLFALLLAGLTTAHAIPTSFFGNGNAVPIVPAFPRFNADLTEEFLDLDRWDASDFSGPWREEPSTPDLQVKRMTANPVVMGEVPMSVVAYGDGESTSEIAVHFIDAGLYFGFRYGGERNREQREAGRAKRREFEDHMEDLWEIVNERLEEGCGRGKRGSVGRTAELRANFMEYRWEEFVLRLVEREEHSISLHIYRDGAAPEALVDEEWMTARRRDRQERLEAAVREREDGGLEITGLPVLTQGMTPYCGIHSLAMVSRYIGLRTSPEALAAGAEFKNTGSAGGSDMVGLHRAVAEELDMRVSISPSLDRGRLERSIEDGLPVIVWRLVSMERENVHAEVARRTREGDQSPLPPLTEKEFAKLPDPKVGGGPTHASVIVGWRGEGDEVIFLEPWGELGLGRRMRWEELEKTAYAVFHFKL